MAGWGIFSQGNSILCLYSVGAAIRVYILWPNTKYRVNKATPKSTPKLAGKCSLLMPKSEGHKEWLIQRPPVFKSILNWPDFCVYVHTRLMSQSSQISGGFSRHMCLTQLDSACQPSVAREHVYPSEGVFTAEVLVLGLGQNKTCTYKFFTIKVPWLLVS